MLILQAEVPVIQSYLLTNKAGISEETGSDTSLILMLRDYLLLYSFHLLVDNIPFQLLLRDLFLPVKGTRGQR